MRKTIDCFLESGGNKFGERIKNCFEGSFFLTKEEHSLFIHILYKDEEVLKVECYKNPYFIARGILSSEKYIMQKVAKVKEYLAQGKVIGLDFMITDKGIILREAKE